MRRTSQLTRSLALILAAGCLAVLVGCGEKDEPKLNGPAVPIDNTQGQNPDGPTRPDVRLQKIGEFTKPVYVTQAPGGSDLFVVEQGGRVVRVAANGGPSRTFLDISKLVSCCDERGLLSIAFAPDYARSHLFYIDYTNKAGDTRVVQYRSKKAAPDAGGAIANPKSARTILKVAQPFPNHNGGLVTFGPDKDLYIGLGDGGSAGDPKRNALDTQSRLGKILRIRPTVPSSAKKTKKGKGGKRGANSKPFTIPGSNPFRNGKTSNGKRAKRALPEIYAYGLRNPWRFSFDRKSGALWIGDVGQDRFEEIDGVSRKRAAGANFGWSAFEGNARYNKDQNAPSRIKPVLTYGHDEGCSVTGGYVVRDPALRALDGRYLYGDFCQGELRSFPARPGKPASDDQPVGLQVPSLSSFGQDLRGRIYAVSNDGPVYRLAAG